MHFGEHLMIDGYGGNEKLLNNKSLTIKALTELPQLLKMKVLNTPDVLYAPDNSKKDPGGWSGFVVIAESHISIHTFPKRRFVSIDVYTCQNGLNVDRIKNYFREMYKLTELEVNFIKRGTKYEFINN